MSYDLRAEANNPVNGGTLITAGANWNVTEGSVLLWALGGVILCTRAGATTSLVGKNAKPFRRK